MVEIATHRKKTSADLDRIWNRLLYVLGALDF